MPSLLDHYADLFDYGLGIEDDITTAEQPSVSAGEVTGEFLRMLKEAEANALEDGKRSQDIETASFAVVAWVDEILARHPAWLGPVTLLQKTLYDTMNAGDLFFDYLKELTEQQDEVREIYYMAMGLGFIGKYYYDKGEKSELVRLKENCGLQIPDPPAAVHRLAEEHITPQPYLSQDPGPPHTYIHWDKLLLRSGTVLAILAPLVVLFLHPGKEPPEERNGVEPIILSRQKIEEQWTDLKCKRLQASISGNNQVTLDGHVSTESDKTELIEKVRRVSGVEGVDANAVEVHAWPYCEIIEILFDYKQRNNEEGFGLDVFPSQPKTDFTEGQFLLLDMTAPNYSAHVYVDYYDLEENVVHILPNAIDTQNSLTPGKHKPLGRGTSGKGRYKIRGPRFGEQMITIIAAPESLFPERRDELEDARSYLKDLRDRLKMFDGKVSAHYFFIETHKKRREP